MKTDCPNDTDGDGDCHLCHHLRGGCGSYMTRMRAYAMSVEDDEPASRSRLPVRFHPHHLNCRCVWMPISKRKNPMKYLVRAAVAFVLAFYYLFQYDIPKLLRRPKR